MVTVRSPYDGLALGGDVVGPADDCVSHSLRLDHIHVLYDTCTLSRGCLGEDGRGRSRVQRAAALDPIATGESATATETTDLGRRKP